MLIQDDLQIGSSPFRAEISNRGGAILVKLSGELDISTAGVLREILSEQVHLPGAATVRLDLLDLSFLDSSGINLLVTACKRVRASGGSFQLTCGYGSIVRRVMEIQGLVDFFELDTSD